MYKKSWKIRARTGGIRRKIAKEYLKINSRLTTTPGNEPVDKASTSATSTVVGGSVHDPEENIMPELESSLQNIQISECGDCSSSDSEYNFDLDNCLTFRKKIRTWANENRIPHSALNKLSNIINEFKPGTLPSDARTFLCTPVNVILKNVEGGQYWHNGIAKPLKSILLNWTDIPDMISININVDGLPIFKSSTNEFWPILGNIFENPRIRPFIIGIYFGKGKPKKLNEFLEDFVNDMKILLEEGLVVERLEKTIKIQIRCFICDSPARAYIKGVCNFNGKHGCHKCTTVGEYSHTTHTVTFSESLCPERTNEGFRNKIYGLHHKNDSPLLNLPIDMVNQFIVADSLHLIDLGVMKRLLIGWRDGNFGKYITKMRASDIALVSNFLCNCKLPSEVHRAVRGLDSLAHWKASEFRAFFHYLSIVILPDVMNNEAYNHFLTLYCSITICSTETYRTLLPLAKELLEHFVKFYKDFYGSGYVTSNIHNLLHLTNEIEMFGPLMTFNAYPFENMLFMIKSMLRSGRKPLSQVAKRLAENMDDIHFQTHKDKKYPFVNTIKNNNVLNFEDFKLSSKEKDSYLLTKCNEVVKICCVKFNHYKILIKGNKINNTEDVFEYPIKSSHLAIYKSRCQQNSTHTLIVLEPKEIKCKLVCIEHKEFNFFIPLLHTYK
ncbi:unnamed protein product [Chilo suppressalis]|uniref:Transposase domain-containing protein n=1 Tax=Chilo suppressalis TaxID=168631 RepID=A0ABN8B7L0_CHISP|nr:unnamed protein product [Chilo suppressalis]